MKISNLKKKTKVIKRAFYRNRVKNFKKLIIYMIIFGMLSSLAYFCKYAYVEYAVSRAHVILNYPEIADSKYPDGSRFTYYDFICDENLDAALEIMHNKGKYLNFTTDDIRDNFYIYSYLDGSAGASVSSARSEGNDFSYVANEYKITFVQPHDYKNKDFFSKFFSKDLSGEFLEALVEVNRLRIAENLGGIKGFELLSSTVSAENYDYSEKVNIYKTKVNNIIQYLEYLDKQHPDFLSEKHNMTINDVKGKYAFLISDSLDGINNFVESSGLSKDIAQISNKININIENNILKFNKADSRVNINSFAMQNYDQTFTENLINVIQSKDYGLYQARPKTAFDTVSMQKHSAGESVSEYETQISKFTTELSNYQNVSITPDENARLTKKCDALIKTFESEYLSLTAVANEVVAEFYNESNESYITAKISPKSLISKNLIFKMGIAFGIGALITFVVAVFISSVRDSIIVRRKKKEISIIKKKSKKGEA